jgi:polar amino acid transport system substrate-binding protein
MGWKSRDKRLHCAQELFQSFNDEVVLTMAQNLITRRNLLSLGGAAVGTIALATLTGCAPGSPAPTKSESKFALIKAMQDRGHAILGVIDSPPSSMVRDNVPTGYNVEIVKAILGKYDIKEFKAFQADFAGMVPGLQAKRMDICCAGLLITDERCKTLAMGPASYVLVYAFAVKPGNPKNLLAIKDLKGTSAILAVEAATTQERIVREILPEKQIITVPGRQDGADAVRIGRADAYLAPNANIRQVLEAGGEPLDVTDVVSDMPQIGSCYAMRLEDADFVEAFRSDFDDLVASGEYAKILKKFGADPTLIETEGVKLTC